MSTLSGTSAAATGLNPYLQQQVGNNSATNTGSAASSNSASEQSADSQIQGTHHGRHHHGGGGAASGLQSQIEQAVTSALGGPDSDSDPATIIQNAIEQVLQNPASASAEPAAAQASANPIADGPDQARSSTFGQFLQSKGVNIDQFKGELANAFQQARATGSSPDLTSAFSSLPPGSIVDANA